MSAAVAVAGNLNLAEHTLWVDNDPLARSPLNGDVEIHRHDVGGRLFVLSTNRLMPTAQVPTASFGKRCGALVVATQVVLCQVASSCSRVRVRSGRSFIL